MSGVGELLSGSGCDNLEYPSHPAKKLQRNDPTNPESKTGSGPNKLVD